MIKVINWGVVGKETWVSGGGGGGGGGGDGGSGGSGGTGEYCIFGNKRHCE